MLEKKIFVKEILVESTITETFLVKSAKKGVTTKGSDYWNLILQDVTGEIEGKIWHPLSAQFDNFENGTFLQIQGDVSSYKEKLQITIKSAQIVSEKDITVADFVKTSAVPAEELLITIEDILAEHILFEPWKQFYKSVLTDSEIRKNFTEGFGAKTVHHAYMGGLLEHTLSVMNLCLLFTEQYPQIDKEILLIGALFHDIGKIEELKNNDHLADFTDEGKLLGHIQLGLELLYPFFKQAKNLPKPFISHLKHMILSHHGELEYGSPKLPATQEALLLHHADNIDAKMSMLDNFYETMQTNEQSWAYHRFLNRDIYLPEKTPTVNKKEKKGIKQCSLPLKG